MLSICVTRVCVAAALCWWLSLTVSWGLAAVFKWSSEAIATRSFVLHLLGWGAPALATIVAVTNNEVSLMHIRRHVAYLLRFRFKATRT